MLSIARLPRHYKEDKEREREGTPRRRIKKSFTKQAITSI